MPRQHAVSVAKIDRVIDARLVQIATLATFLAAQIVWFDFGASLRQAAVSVVSALAFQALLCRAFSMTFDWRSPFITGLSLALLLRSPDPMLWCAASGLAMCSKFLIRPNGKHLFNPACFAIVTLLLLSGHVWVSPGQWGTPMWLAFLAGSMGGLILSRAERLDIALAFLGCYGALLVARCLVLGDPMTIPAHQMHSGALLIFGLFMITDPRSTPDSRPMRMIFAAAVAGAAYWLQFHLQSREGLFYALILISFSTPFLDRWHPHARFLWASQQKA